MPDTVKIVRFHKTGGAEVLQIDELPLPEPGAGEVRLRVKAIGLNRAEIMFRNDKYIITPDLPAKNGYEASGIVEAVGPGVDPGLIGQIRSTIPAFSLNQYGMYGEVAIVSVSAIAAYPEKLSFEEGTSIWMQYLTVYGALIHHGRIAPGNHVVITAASSSVGLAAIQITKAEGGIAIATTRTAAKKDELLAAGADHVIVTDEEDIVARVQEITNGDGAKIIFDPIAGPGINELSKAAGKDALIILYGMLASEPTPFPLMAAWEKSGEGKPFKVMGYVLHEITTNPERLKKAAQYVFEKLESGQLTPRIDRTFPLSEIVEAHRYMESGNQIGKIVVTV